MREQFIDDFMTQISPGIKDEQILRFLKKELTKYIDNYEVTERHTELVPYNTIPKCVQIYLVTRKIEGLSHNSLSLYKLRLEQFFTDVQIPIERIHANDIRVFLYQYQERSGCSDRTLEGFRGIICTFFKWAAAEGYVDKNPCGNIRAIKYTRTKRGYLSDMEMEMLRNACDTPRDTAIVETLYSTGCRVAELINLKISDVDFQKGEVILFGKGSKYRTSYINAKAEYAIRKYLDSRSDECEYLFVTERNPHTKIASREVIERRIAKLGRNAGIKKDVFPHLIRHTTATLGLQRGMDVQDIQRMLGHEKIDTTLIYAEVADETVKENHKRYIV